MARIKKLEDNLKRLTPLQDSLDSQKSKDWDKFKEQTEAVMNDVRNSEGGKVVH